jgi:hypothetical protein
LTFGAARRENAPVTYGRPLRRAPLALALIAAAVWCAPAAAAPGKLLDKSADEGYATVFATGGAQSPRAFIVRVKATPNQRVEVRWDVTCAKGRSGRAAIGEFTMSGKGKRKLKMPVKRSPDCIANVLVGWADTGDTGKLRVELFVR